MSWPLAKLKFTNASVIVYSEAVDVNRRAVERIARDVDVVPAAHQKAVGGRLLGRLAIEQAIRHLRHEAQQLRPHARLLPQHIEVMLGVLRDLEVCRTDLMSARREVAVHASSSAAANSR